MKLFKKLFTLLLAFVLTFTGTCNFVFASSLNDTSSSEVTKDTMIEYMKNIGTPQEYLDLLTDQKLSDLYYRFQGKNMKFSGFSKEIMTIPASQSSGDLQPYGTIPDSKLLLILSTFDQCSDTNMVISVEVEAYFQWLTTPFFDLTDAMTINWNQNLFTMQGFFAESGYNYIGQWTVLDHISSPSTAQPGGVGCHLKTGQRPEMMGDPTSGTISILLFPKKVYYANEYLGEQLFFSYAHHIIGPSISLGASFGGSISGSWGVGFTGGLYDSMTLVKNYHFS